MTRELIINSHVINEDSECFVIAEIGHNHQGNVEKAKSLFLTAKQCGVSAVKLQKRDVRSLYTSSVYQMPYINENSFGATYGSHREALEFDRDEYIELKQYAKELGITMFATAFDFSSVDLLAELNMPAYKIASGDLTNIPLLKHVSRVNKPIILSTGGGTMEDVRRAYDTIMPVNSQLCILQCTASYPVELEEMNLRVITTYRERFPDVVIGLSDHQNGIAMAPVAYMLGARVIEKHFTLNHTWKGTDHAFSLEPIGMQKMVRDLHHARLAMGNGIKCRYASEKNGLYKMGKKIVAAKDLPVGHILAPSDIAFKSPNDGLPPYELKNVIGKMTTRALREDENICFEDLNDAKQIKKVESKAKR